MSCKPVCQLCPRLVISQSVTFDGTSLIINLPAGSYANGEKYCIVIAQTIPVATTINAPVVITIGDGTEEYPLTNRCCAQVTAAALRTRTRYSTVVGTSTTSAVFKMLGRGSCAPSYNLAAVDGTAPAAAAAGGDGA